MKNKQLFAVILPLVVIVGAVNSFKVSHNGLVQTQEAVSNQFKSTFIISPAPRRSDGLSGSR